MELAHLETFRAVTRTGSFTSAGEQLHYVQSTVSVHIRSLEGEIGLPLFDRLPSGIRLTEAGARLMPIAEQMLDLAAAAGAVAGPDTEAVGEISMAAPETVVAHRLPPLLRHLREKHPHLQLRLESLPYGEIYAAVAAGRIDAGFLLQPPVQSTSSVAVQHLRTEPLRMVAATTHPLAAPVDDVAEEFWRTTVFLTERGCGYRHLLEAHLDRVGVRAGHTLEFDSVEAARRCVEAGLGVALIPEAWLSQSLASGALASMEWFAPRIDIATQLIWNAARWRGPALSAVIEAAERSIAGGPP